MYNCNKVPAPDTMFCSREGSEVMRVKTGLLLEENALFQARHDSGLDLGERKVVKRNGSINI